MSERFLRNELYFGKGKTDKLKEIKVCVVGLGGVGAYAVEALARLGVANFVVIDKDVVDITNLNRQIIALESTLGRNKSEVVKERILDKHFSFVNSYMKSFLLMLNKDNNLDMLTEISNRFILLYKEYMGIEYGVVYGVSISEKELKTLEECFSKKFSKKVYLNFKKDISLISGYRVEVGKKVYDNSYKYKLEILRNSLKKEA